jgi:hypothetical protein
LLAEADSIKRFIKVTTREDFTLGSDSIKDEDILPGYSRENELLDRLTTRLDELTREYIFPVWTYNWYLKAKAWRAAGHVDSGDEV